MSPKQNVSISTWVLKGKADPTDDRDDRKDERPACFNYA
jgi:hypothetical protein